jgi:hypothetical protein
VEWQPQRGGAHYRKKGGKKGKRREKEGKKKARDCEWM